MKRPIRVYPVIATLVGAALFVACTDGATAPDTVQFARARGEPANFTRCQPQPYSSSGGWIGPKGGTLRAGKNVLKVPAGALNGRVFITMETTADDINHVVFRPEGLVFNSNALPSLVMSYQDCLVLPGAQQRVAYVSQEMDVLEHTPSYSDPLSQTVEGKLSHFSDYVLLSTYAVVY